MKYLFIIFAFILGLFASNWIFNHINPWIGWVGYIVTIGLTLRYVAKKLMVSAKGDQTKVDSKKN